MMNIEFLWDSLNNQAQLINHEYTNKNIFLINLYVIKF